MEEQEVQLIDYLNVIWRRKGLILGGTLLATVIALAVSLSKPKAYEVSRSLKIGVVQGKAVESREAVIKRFEDERVLADAIKQFQLDITPEEMAEGFISVKKTTRGSPDPHVRYTVRAPDPQLATRLADWFAKRVGASHKWIFDRRMEIARAYEVKLEATVPRVEADVAGMERTLQGLMSAPEVNAPAVILVQANIDTRQARLQDLRRELQEVRLSLLPPDSENTTIITSDVLPQRPVNPRVKLNVVIAGVLGLFSFTFLAFFMEYLAKVRRERSEERT